MPRCLAPSRPSQRSGQPTAPVDMQPSSHAAQVRLTLRSQPRRIERASAQATSLSWTRLHRHRLWSLGCSKRSSTGSARGFASEADGWHLLRMGLSDQTEIRLRSGYVALRIRIAGTAAGDRRRTCGCGSVHLIVDDDATPRAASRFCMLFGLTGEWIIRLYGSLGTRQHWQAGAVECAGFAPPDLIAQAIRIPGPMWEVEPRTRGPTPHAHHSRITRTSLAQRGGHA